MPATRRGGIGEAYGPGAARQPPNQPPHICACAEPAPPMSARPLARPMTAEYRAMRPNIGCCAAIPKLPLPGATSPAAWEKKEKA